MEMSTNQQCSIKKHLHVIISLTIYLSISIIIYIYIIINENIYVNTNYEFIKRLKFINPQPLFIPFCCYTTSPETQKKYAPRRLDGGNTSWRKYFS